MMMSSLMILLHAAFSGISDNHMFAIITSMQKIKYRTYPFIYLLFCL